MSQLRDYVKDNSGLVMEMLKDYHVGDKEVSVDVGTYSVSASADLVTGSGQWRVPVVTRCASVSTRCGQVHVSPYGATQMLLSSYDTGQCDIGTFVIKPHSLYCQLISLIMIN